MNQMSDAYQRRSIRLHGYDYAEAGAYFVTICVHYREFLFGEVAGEEMKLNAVGAIVQECWNDLPRHYANVELDAFIVMPNHVHGIINLSFDREIPAPVGAGVAAHVGAGLRPAQGRGSGRAGFKPAPTKPLSEIVRAFKTFSARRINEIRAMPGVPVWQRNYYEHIVRDDDELNGICQYIMDNPAQWALDRENPAVVGMGWGGVGAQHAEPLRNRDDIERIFGGVRL